MQSKHVLSLVLAGSLGATGLAAVPAAHAASRPAANPAPTATPAKGVLLALTPSATNRGGVVLVSGSGFAPNEAIDLFLSGITNPLAVAKADAKGLLPPTALSIPYSVKPGAYTIMATGLNSKRSGKAAVTVAALAPSIALSSATASPGATETVTGKGFGRQEQITLSLNGEALVTSPSVITTTNGGFTASFKVPNSILRGDNTISAIGNESRISAVAHLTGNLPRSPQFYFAGGLNTSRDHAYVDLLNTNNQPASVRLTFYFDTGYSRTFLTTVNAHSEKRVKVANLGNLPEGRYGLEVQSDRQIAAQVSTERTGQDSDEILGVSAPALQWYLAAGSTKGTFQERVSILNPDLKLAAHVQLQLVGSNNQRKTMTVTVPAHTNYVASVNSLMGNSDVSVITIADRPVVVERTLGFGPGMRGYTTRAGANKAATQWMFSDGTTENSVRTVYAILNPGDYPATVSATFSQQNGHVLGSKSIVVPARSRGTIVLNDVVHGGGIAAMFTSNQAVVVERSEYIGTPDQATAGSVVVGRNGAAARWTFPSGNTTPGNDEALDLYNPSSVTIPITATFYQTSGQVVTKSYTLLAGARMIIPVNTLFLTPIHGAVLQSGNGQGFIAEQGISRRDSTILMHTQGYAQ